MITNMFGCKIISCMVAGLLVTPSVHAQSSTGSRDAIRVSPQMIGCTLTLGRPIAPFDHDDIEQLWKQRDLNLQNEISPKVQLVAKALLPSDQATGVPFHCIVRYLSTKEGKIITYYVSTSTSVSREFKFISLGALRSLQGSDMLKFPEGTRFSKSWNEIAFDYSGPGDGGVGVKLSQEEMRNLMKRPIAEIHEIIKAPPAQIHERLGQSKPAA